MTATSSNKRTIVIWVLAAVILSALLFLIAPWTNRLNSGSTWSYTPDGYAAWYDYMAEQGTPVERWQQPIENLVDAVDTASGTDDSPAVLIRVLPPGVVNSRNGRFTAGTHDWLTAGNVMITLAFQSQAIAPTFSSEISNDIASPVLIQTRRRLSNRVTYVEKPFVLSDEAGGIVWQYNYDRLYSDEDIGDENSGIEIEVITPFLAANAYQNAPGNFDFLAALATQYDGPIYIDEYAHGYEDEFEESEAPSEGEGGRRNNDWLIYLLNTPLAMLTAQSAIALLIYLIAQNRQPGRRLTIESPPVNNSAAYTQALAGVLHKANNRDFLVDTLTRSERKALQHALGLGETPVPLDVLQTAWQQSTGRNVGELAVLERHPRSEKRMRQWLVQLQSLKRLARNQSEMSAEEVRSMNDEGS